MRNIVFIQLCRRLILAISLTFWGAGHHFLYAQEPVFSFPWDILGEKQTEVSPLVCFHLLDRAEKQHNIPRHLLKAIALTESGRPFDKNLFIPWPWTINVNGKGYFFRTKAEAIQAVVKFQSQGIKSIDVGCMQINLHHHAHAFPSLEAAFDPRINISYGARFLKNLKAQKGNWHLAIAHYHSSNPLYYKVYTQRVLKQQESMIASPPSSDMPKHKPIWISLMQAPVNPRSLSTQVPKRTYAFSRESKKEAPLPVRISSIALRKEGQDIVERMKHNPLNISQNKPLKGSPPDIKKIPPLQASYHMTAPHLRPRLIAFTGLKTVG